MAANNDPIWQVTLRSSEGFAPLLLIQSFWAVLCGNIVIASNVIRFYCHYKRTKNAIGSIRWRIPENLPIGAKNSYASRVIANYVPNFVAMATGSVGKKCNWQHSMDHSRKPPYRRKNLAKISYASRVIAHFVPNFVAMATGVGQGKMHILEPKITTLSYTQPKL